ncbi:MAG TPA: hypothetical protein VEC99_05870 [Clostridia bacterium]|nr:hypothetical protein [Clostridia bacterium]
MKIISTRQQFIADHSSTNYFFYAAKPLSREVRAYANTLSSHVDVGSRTAEITYHGDFADLGEERRKKFLTHFDVEVRESYDWWTLSVMLEPDRVAELGLQEFEVENESSLIFTRHGKRICLSFDGWHMDSNAAYGEFDEEIMQGLAELGLELRAELYAGKTEVLKVMQAYCAEGTILEEPKSPVARKLANILEVI